VATLVCFHAHPDDEAIATAGVMALAADAGHRVVLVLATRGELGEPVPGVLEAGEPLWRRREQEAMDSAQILGAQRVEFLGFTDSGMMGEPTNDDPGCFWQADVEAAAARLAALLADETVDALTIYDDHGLYGHPDHIQVHRVGRRAAELMELPAARVFCSTMNRDLMRERWARAAAEAAAADRATTATPDPVRELDELDIDTFGLPAEDITHAIDVRTMLDRKRRSMLAHRSQIADDAFYLGSPDGFEAAFGTEWFASLGPRRAPGSPFGATLLEVRP
jgi:LmbE family N-acetylglucosaminyl deacetylase